LWAAVFSACAAATEGAWELSWSTIDGGGGMWSTAGNLELSGTIGQPDAGAAMTGGNYALTAGLWAGVPAFPIGDLNCDGSVDLFDIDPFVLALTSAGENPPFQSYYAAYPACDARLADIDGNGVVDLFDIDPFVVLLTGG